uniref:GST C-terminal domain-containing protein n=1 Tax=Corethron hystrix TaxID=216773 RepID=A0A7S1BKN8_9STRA|mmetsp:Transcript_29359/g.67431  ORF Transcript_29359/g.67431 Transcript_29359/m.67431 type:complete len:159 (+) Transcript_29359:549-1025(+)
MYPLQDFVARQRVDSFLAAWYPTVDSYYDILTSRGETAVGRAVIDFVASLAVLEEELGRGSDVKEGAPFVLGKIFSLAECVAAPWVQRFFMTLPHFRGIDFEEDILSQNGFKQTAHWMRAVIDRPSVIASKCPEDEVMAAAMRYYVSYVSPGAPADLL